MRSGSFAYYKEFLSDFYFELSKKYGIDLTFKIFLSAGRGLGQDFFSSRVFSFGFVMVGRSFLLIGIEKGQSIFSAVLMVVLNFHGVIR